MPMETATDRLAQAAGILPEYTDKMGQVHVTSLETKRRFLSSMGFAAATDEEAAASLAAFEDASWLRHCPPVLVVREKDLPVHVPLFLPPNTAPEIGLRLEEESGPHHDIFLKLESARVLESREIAGETWQKHDVTLPFMPPQGYHRIQVDLAGTLAQMTLIVVPERCYLPAWLDRPEPERVWGIPCQIYALRSHRNWGIGDFTDLSLLVGEAARAGASLIGLNPLCALFPEDPENAGPYCSNNRLFINALYVDVEAVPDYAESVAAQALVASADFQARLAQVRAADWIDYTKVAGLKYPVFEAMFAHFRGQHLDADKGVTGRGRTFEIFCEQGGLALRQFATYQALAGMMVKGGFAPGWREWPQPWRDSHSGAVQALSHDARVQFFMYLQWLAEEQLAAAADAGRQAGLSVGLYPDQTVGVAGDSSETWAQPDLFVHDLFIGAPPDLRRPRGQNWGLAPMLPHVLQETGYQHFRAIVGRNMKHAGALRIDHIMGIMRKFWAPVAVPGEKVVRGAYVAYPFEDLLGILALESQRHACLVLGEDLGTVPQGFRERMAEMGILATRVLYRQCAATGDFLGTSFYPALANVTISNHDQPTLSGWWVGHDLELFEKHGLFLTEEGRNAAFNKRRGERERLVRLLDIEEGWPNGQAFAPRLTEAHLCGDEMPPDLLEASIAFLAKTPSAIVLLQLEDVFGQPEQVNLPGTVREYPNWRRRLPTPLEDMGTHEGFGRITALLRKARPFA